MSGKVIVDTLQNGTGSTFDLATNISQLARVKTYEVTDATDITPSTSANAYTVAAAPATKTLAATWSNVILPTKGLIYYSFTGRLHHTTTTDVGPIIFCLRISSTDYYFISTSDSSLNRVAGMYVTTGTTAWDFYGWEYGNDTSAGIYKGIGIDIAAQSLPTGSQTVELRCWWKSETTETQPTIKGTGKTSRHRLTIYDFT